MGKEMATIVGLSYGGLDSIAERLSRLPELHFPNSFYAGRREQEVTQEERKNHLVALLHRDAALFLERYGKILQLFELTEFEPLNGDYEVNWHLTQLKAVLNPSTVEQKSQAATVKNRRLAFMEQLVKDGQYFTEEAMRMRCPLLHHEYVGQFQDPSTWTSFQRRGDKLADVLIRQCDEAFVQQKLEEERRQAGIADQEEEEDEEEEEGDGREDDESLYIAELNALSSMQLSSDRAGCSSEGQERKKEPNSLQEQMSRQANRLADKSERREQFASEIMAKFMAEDKSKTTSKEELEDKLEAFTRVMQEKFLSGEDSEHFDYKRIDQNSDLDEHWLFEVGCDAEEKYFEED